MTKHEIRMTNESPMSNDVLSAQRECQLVGIHRHSGFVIISSFGLRYSSLARSVPTA
jgi:hypothetical protein